MEDPDPNAAYFQSLSESDRAAYAAVGSTCSESANEAVADLFPSALISRTAQDWLADAQQRALADPRVGEQQDWKACMTAEGFDVPGPTGLFEFVATEEPIAEFHLRWEDAHGGLESLDDLPAIEEVFTAAEIAQIRLAQEKEIALAVANWDCGAGVDQLVTEIVLEYLAE